MSKILYVTANPKSVDQSYGLRLGKYFTEQVKTKNGNVLIEHVDLFKEDIPFVDADVLSAREKLASNESLTSEEAAKIGRIDQILDQFLSADSIVFVTPLWNFTVPAYMKAYLDCLCLAGKTFKYKYNGVTGLITGKKILHIQTIGGVFSEGPYAEYEMGDRYVKSIMAFIGLTDYQKVVMEGTNQFRDQIDQLFEKAKQQLDVQVEQFV
ncbi:FMN-dependent NADH-azoreductase 2 [Paenibacillus chitinolyticus]|uniref:FMN-dependent NADH-azoreductase n=1 Tax=Paenibacillus chitinolyticus TaxID=79263 RepID=UPI0026E4FB0B|nr:FMN-dependent NADH-azoreductase [Paenibacillus chitinolyticus]GKS09850.1 FMN-dependent NADH-azoreductase 2 [Paenibacillus chitinolyticus]